jgi:hypothetical protein
MLADSAAIAAARFGMDHMRAEAKRLAATLR